MCHATSNVPRKSKELVQELNHCNHLVLHHNWCAKHGLRFVVAWVHHIFCPSGILRHRRDQLWDPSPSFTVHLCHIWDYRNHSPPFHALPPRLSYLFTHLHLLSSDSFSSVIFSLLLLSSLTLPTSAFPSDHIVGSLTSKLPSALNGYQWFGSLSIDTLNYWKELEGMNQWIGWRGIFRKPWFSTKHIRGSCKITVKPLHWMKQIVRFTEFWCLLRQKTRFFGVSNQTTRL